jgi:hypothetical protein
VAILKKQSFLRIPQVPKARRIYPVDLSKFHVVSMISNPVEYKSRYRLYSRFKEHMKAAGVNFWTCEIAHGERPFVITERDEPNVLQLRTFHEIWHKENALNLMVSRLPWDWRYVAWIDADIEFTTVTGEDAWYRKAISLLQNYAVIQLFQNCIDLGPYGEVIQTHQAFAFSYVTKRPQGKKYSHWHPGYAWAMRREAWDAMGGLIDYSILGSGDNHCAYGWIGRIEDSVHHQVSGPYFDALKVWQGRCERYIRRDMGFLPGSILHQWHGKKKQRYYESRWKILTETKFDPSKDLKEDYQGLYQLHDHGDLRSIELRDRIKAYFRSRNEDSIDVE